MSDLVGNPEDQFSQNEAHLKPYMFQEIDKNTMTMLRTQARAKEIEEREQLVGTHQNIIEILYFLTH